MINVILIHNQWNGVAIYGLVCGLRPGNHGWHIHQYGQYNGRCDNAGPHFALIRYPHAGPTDRFRHNGDLGNLQADQRGIAYVNQFNGQVTIIPESNSSIIGRAILVNTGNTLVAYLSFSFSFFLSFSTLTNLLAFFDYSLDS